MQTSYGNGILTLRPTEHVDAANAPVFEKEIQESLEKYQADTVVIDCDHVEFMSSAGLRIILRLKQKIDRTSLINVHPGFYEILDTTGFTELMEVKKAYRVVSLEGCELIGQGANGKVYRLDRENIIKVYKNADALPAIHHGGGYGSIYELLNAKTYVQLLQSGEKSLDELVEMSTELLKLIHSRIVKQSVVPDIKDTALLWVEILKDCVPGEVYDKLYAMIDAVPDDMHMLHGDYHFRNIMYQNEESLLIDMDKLSHGHPVFELAAIYNAYCGFGTTDPSVVEEFLGIPCNTAAVIWRKTLERYLETKEESRLQAVEIRARIIGHARIMQHYIRRNGQNTEAGRRQIAYSRVVLEEVLPRVDTLLF